MFRFLPIMTTRNICKIHLNSPSVKCYKYKRYVTLSQCILAKLITAQYRISIGPNLGKPYSYHI
jgi:hypothetical protein